MNEISEFTSHYVSINSIRDLKKLYNIIHLHPTMYLLILVYRLTDALVCLHLHPTMYLLIQSAGADPAERGT